MSEPSVPIPRSQYEKHLLRATSSDSYLIIPRCLWRVIPDKHPPQTRHTCALFLQDLSTKATSAKTVKQEIDGEQFFLCTESYLADSDFNWSAKEQERYLEILRDARLIKITGKGTTPRRRWVHIQVEALEKAKDEAELKSPLFWGDLSTQIRGDYSPPIGGINNNKEEQEQKKGEASSRFPTPSPIKNGFNGKGRNRHRKPNTPESKTNKIDDKIEDRHREWYRLLRKIIRSRPGGCPNESENGPRQFYLLERSLVKGGSKNPEKVINSTLEDYTKYVKDIIKPKIDSATQFRKRWEWITDEISALADSNPNERIKPRKVPWTRQISYPDPDIRGNTINTTETKYIIIQVKQVKELQDDGREKWRDKEVFEAPEGYDGGFWGNGE